MNVLIVSFLALGLNVFFGKWRVRYKKFSLKWWLLIHASIPLLIPVRILLNTPKIFIPLFIALAVAGQFLGSRFSNI
ncbi:MAG TPA: hypothetical protein VHO46_05710 [Bacteroidales bacterium]|nr:hypothetical protein [Bacteroidales bacterium]